MNAKNFFRFKDPNPVADHEDEMISVMQSNRVDISGQYSFIGKNKTPKNEDQEADPHEFNDNPNLGNVIKMLENKHSSEDAQEDPHQTNKRAQSKNEVARSRKFKKALNSLGARQERIEMVRGLALNAADNVKIVGKEGKKINNGPGEETESTMTHKEIDDFATRFNLTWQ